MTHVSKQQQSFAERLSNVLRRYEREGGDVGQLAANIGQERRDLTRWANGTTMPAHILIDLCDELPRHLADRLISNTRLRFASKQAVADANALRAASAASRFSSDVAERHADGEFCHRDRSATKEHAQRVIAELQQVAGE